MNDIDLKINIKDLVGDEEYLFNAVVEGIVHSFNKRFNDQLNGLIKTTVTDRLNELLPGILDHEYVVVDDWGNDKGTWTVRRRITDFVASYCVLKNASSGYSSDRNAFTNAVVGAVNQNMESFKKEFSSNVDAKFIAEAMEFAEKRLREKLGIKR